MSVTINLSWPANPVAEAISGYEVWESKDLAPFAFKTSTPIGVTTLAILNPIAGAYRWQVKAKNFVGTGPFSPEVDGPNIPSAPGQPTVVVIVT